MLRNRKHFRFMFLLQKCFPVLRFYTMMKTEGRYTDDLPRIETGPVLKASWKYEIQKPADVQIKIKKAPQHQDHIRAAEKEPYDFLF